jgi:hypothetical protein
MFPEGIPDYLLKPIGHALAKDLNNGRLRNLITSKE